MVTLIVRFQVQEGKEPAAIAAMEKMATAVQASEPGALAYTFNRSKMNPREFYIYELYKDAEALTEHNKTEHMRDLQIAFAGFMDRSSFKVEMLEQAAGFIRGA
jgi:quinol monooxygenase YgiN